MWSQNATTLKRLSQIMTSKPIGNQTVEEWRSQFVTSNFAKMGLRRPPYAFTRNGIGMLSKKIFATGCVWDAWTYVSDLVRSAKQRIVLIDNYVDDRVLSPRWKCLLS